MICYLWFFSLSFPWINRTKKIDSLKGFLCRRSLGRWKKIYWHPCLSSDGNCFYAETIDRLFSQRTVMGSFDIEKVSEWNVLNVSIYFIILNDNAVLRCLLCFSFQNLSISWVGSMSPCELEKFKTFSFDLKCLDLWMARW